MAKLVSWGVRTPGLPETCEGCSNASVCGRVPPSPPNRSGSAPALHRRTARRRDPQCVDELRVHLLCLAGRTRPGGPTWAPTWRPSHPWGRESERQVGGGNRATSEAGSGASASDHAAAELSQRPLPGGLPGRRAGPRLPVARAASRASRASASPRPAPPRRRVPTSSASALESAPRRRRRRPPGPPAPRPARRGSAARSHRRRAYQQVGARVRRASASP